MNAHERVATLAQRVEELERALMLAILTIDCERNGLTPNGNVRERLVATLNKPTAAARDGGVSPDPKKEQQ
jgi:hypothetical protein